MKTELIQNCRCVINLYPDGSLGGAEIGELCDLHHAAPELFALLKQISDRAKGKGPRLDYDQWLSEVHAIVERIESK